MLIDAPALSSRASAVVSSAARVGDPAATRTVYTTIAVLVVLGIVLAALAWWVLRRTRPEVELLAPLEVMQTRGWRKLDPATQRRLLDESRPVGAMPRRREASPPEVDASFATIAPVASFDDLSDTGVDIIEISSSDPESAGTGEADVDDAHDDNGEGGEAPTDGRHDTGEIPVVVVADDDEPDVDEAPAGRSIDPLLTPRRTAPDRD